MGIVLHMLEQHIFTMKTFYSTGSVIYCIVL
jgi:hypothetical protein